MGYDLIFGNHKYTQWTLYRHCEKGNNNNNNDNNNDNNNNNNNNNKPLFTVGEVITNSSCSKQDWADKNQLKKDWKTPRPYYLKCLLFLTPSFLPMASQTATIQSPLPPPAFVHDIIFEGTKHETLHPANS